MYMFIRGGYSRYQVAWIQMYSHRQDILIFKEVPSMQDYHKPTKQHTLFTIIFVSASALAAMPCGT